MKKLLGIVVLGLLWCNVGFAEIVKLSRCYWTELDSPNEELSRASFDEMKNMRMHADKKEHQIKQWKKIDWIINTTEGTGRFESILINGLDETKVHSRNYVLTFYDDDFAKLELVEKKIIGASIVIEKTEITINLNEHTVDSETKSTQDFGDGLPPIESSTYVKFKCEKKESGSGTGTAVASSGSGFFINNKGYFITNYHVVAGCNDKSKITFKNEDMDAKLIAKDKSLDLAVLRVKVKPKYYLNLANYPPTKLTNIIVAGYPFGKGLSDDIKYTRGIISSLKGFEDNSNEIQIDAAINPGNSGGPIVTEDGNVIAVAVSGLAKDKSEGINFGIKASSVKNFLDVNAIKYDSSGSRSKISIEKLNKLLDVSTVYTFCN